VTENNTSADCIRFNAVLGLMFQPVFSVFLFHLPYIEQSQSQCQCQAQKYVYGALVY